jgi:hypothetical protein
MLGRQDGLEGDDVLDEEENELIRVAAWEHGARAIIEAVKTCGSKEVRDPATRFLKVHTFAAFSSCSLLPLARASCKG